MRGEGAVGGGQAGACLATWTAKGSMPTSARSASTRAGSSQGHGTGEPSFTPAIWVPWICFRPSLTRVWSRRRGQVARAREARLDRLLQQARGASLDVELVVGVLGDQPRGACGLLPAWSAVGPTVLVHDRAETVAVACGEAAPGQLLGGVVAVPLGREAVVRRRHVLEFRRERGTVVRHSPTSLCVCCSGHPQLQGAWGT